MTVDDHTAAHEFGAPMRSQRAGPLVDVRVLDLTQHLAGPYCTMLLADMGADVIKVESPSGDPPRWLGPHTEVDDDHDLGGYFASVNRNKRAIVLDLKEESDRDLLLRLVDDADVLVENYRAGVMDKLGLGYEIIHDRNPKLVYGAIRGFGDPRTGETPYTYRPAYDIVAQAMSGFVSITGTEGGERVSAGPSIGDLYPATMAAVGVLGALHHARATGEGQFVDIGMADALLALCESMVWRYSYTGEVQAPLGTAHASVCPFEIYATADGACAIAAPGTADWAELCRIVGREDLIDDDETRTPRRRMRHRKMIRDVIETWTRVRTTEAVVDVLAGRVPVGPVHDATTLVDDPHVRAREMLVAIDHPGSARPVLTPNTPLRFTATPGGVYRSAPRLGEHTAEILAELDAPDDRRRSAGPPTS